METEHTKLIVFQSKKLRRVWFKDEWYYSLVDIVQALTESSNPTDYLKKLRKRDVELGLYQGTNCPQVEMLTETEKKNPVIAGVFKQIGNADDLGSGVRNLVKYTKLYSNSKPEIHDEDIFRIIIPTPQATMQATDQATMQATDQATTYDERTKLILNFCKTEKSTTEIMAHLGLTHRRHFRLGILKPLLNKKLLFLTIPDKPNSPNQKYYSQRDKNE